MIIFCLRLRNGHFANIKTACLTLSQIMFAAKRELNSCVVQMQIFQTRTINHSCRMTILHCQPCQLHLSWKWFFLIFSDDATKWVNLRPTLEFTVAFTAAGPMTRIWNNMRQFVEHTIQDELDQVAFWIVPRDLSIYVNFCCPV